MDATHRFRLFPSRMNTHLALWDLTQQLHTYDQRKTHTNITGPAAGKRWRDAQPKPSGLLGPVRLRFPREILFHPSS